MADAKKSTKVLKIKVGSVFIDGKSHDVFNDAWEKESKKGEKYYEIRTPVFVQEIKEKDKSA